MLICFMMVPCRLYPVSQINDDYDAVFSAQTDNILSCCPFQTRSRSTTVVHCGYWRTTINTTILWRKPIQAIIVSNTPRRLWLMSD